MTPDFLFPLQKRTRSVAVTAQLTELCCLNRGAVRRRVAETDPSRRLERETLVALVRGYLRVGSCDEADKVLEILIGRVSGAIAGKIGTWAGLTPDDRVDAQRQMVAVLCEQVSDLSSTAEFWECNFTVCFQRRLITLWHILTDRKLPTMSTTTKGSDGEAYDRSEQFADPADPLAEIEMKSLVEIVSGGSAKKSEAIFLRVHGFSDEEIAKRLDVSSRSLRNWAAEARAAWNRQARL